MCFCSSWHLRTRSFDSHFLFRTHSAAAFARIIPFIAEEEDDDDGGLHITHAERGERERERLDALKVVSAAQNWPETEIAREEEEMHCNGAGFVAYTLHITHVRQQGVYE